jgi:hypothetical protein
MNVNLRKLRRINQHEEVDASVLIVLRENNQDRINQPGR